MPTPRDGKRGLREIHAVNDSTTMSDQAVIDSYLRAKANRWRPETLRVRRAQLGKISRDIGVPYTLLTEKDVLHWHEGLDGRPETIASYTSALTGLMRWMAVRARPRLRDDDPTLILDRPKIPEALPRPMLDRHYDLALACATADPEMYAWLALMGCAGLRCCEIAWLQTGDVELREDGTGKLHFEGKGGKRRVVPIGSTLVPVLELFLTGRGPVFTRPSDGRAHTPGRVSTRVNKFLREINVPGTAHQLRHRFGTDLHALEPDLYKQAQLMGHSSIKTTQRYTLVEPMEALQHIEALTRRRIQPGHRWAA